MKKLLILIVLCVMQYSSLMQADHSGDCNIDFMRRYNQSDSHILRAQQYNKKTSEEPGRFVQGKGSKKKYAQEAERATGK